jgi:membrane protein DedA with SNARE-associated domain
MAPGVREIISIPAGLSKMNLPKFIVFTFAGSSIWSITLTLIVRIIVRRSLEHILRPIVFNI